jgi:hypothetical protein
VGLSVDDRPIKEGNDDKGENKSELKSGVAVVIELEPFVNSDHKAEKFSELICMRVKFDVPL